MVENNLEVTSPSFAEERIRLYEKICFRNLNVLIMKVNVSIGLMPKG